MSFRLSLGTALSVYNYYYYYYYYYYYQLFPITDSLRKTMTVMQMLFTST